MVALSDPVTSFDRGALCYSLKVRAVVCVCDPYKPPRLTRMRCL